jgi:hypothetical protein
MVIEKDPAQVTAAEVFEFLAHQRGRPDGGAAGGSELGLSARTIPRRQPASQAPGPGHAH